MKRKGMTLDVSSSKALADSLDQCVVSLNTHMSEAWLMNRIQKNLNSTPWSGSWLRDVCWLPNTSVLEVSRKMPMGITV
jgi:hypothetical protein